MALEQEIMEQEAKLDKEAKATESEENKNFDDLTDEEIEAVKELEQSAWWKVLTKCMEKRIKKQEEDIVSLAKNNFMDPKKMGYTCFEVLGGFVQWMGEMERLVKVITADPEEIRKAVEALNKMDQEAVEGKKKWK